MSPTKLLSNSVKGGATLLGAVGIGAIALLGAPESAEAFSFSGPQQYLGKTVHRRDAWSPQANFDQSVTFPTNDGQSDIEFTMDFGNVDGLGNIPITIPQNSFQWGSAFISSPGDPPSFTIDIVAAGDGSGTLYMNPGAPVDYERITTVSGISDPIFSGSGPAGSAVIEIPLGIRIWLDIDVRDGQGGILANAGSPDLQFDVLTFDTTGTAISRVDPTGCSNCVPDDVNRVLMSTGKPFDLESGNVEFGMAFALLELPAGFEPAPGLPIVDFVNLQVSDGISVEPVPEPSTVLMSVLGLGAMLGLKKTKKSNS